MREPRKFYEDLVENIALADLINNEVDVSGLYVFISFDLVHSTRFKLQNPGKWQLTFLNFFLRVTHFFTNSLSQIQIWKYIGDEVVFYCKVNSRSELGSILGITYATQQDIIEVLQSQEPPSAKQLSVKSTVWPAYCKNLTKSENDIAASNIKINNNDNIRVSLGSRDETMSIDFLGPDIDRGFRLSKHATRARVLVSAEFAYLFHKANLHYAPNSGLRIVDYAPLKDILDGRPYPLVWFEKDWDAVDSTFFYDEKMQNKAIENIIHGKMEQIGGIVKIIKDLHEDQRLDAVLAALSSD
ncbi:hypothetical protein [Megalodesulfovibrio paquesii]